MHVLGIRHDATTEEFDSVKKYLSRFDWKGKTIGIEHQGVVRYSKKKYSNETPNSNSGMMLSN